VQSLGKIVWRLLRKLKTEFPYDPAIPVLGIYLDKIIIQKIHALLCLQQHHVQQPRHGNSLNVHRPGVNK